MSWRVSDEVLSIGAVEVTFKPSTFFEELRRRKVYRVAAAYGAVGIAIAIAVPDLFGAFRFPDWAAPLAIVFIAIGFPIALVLGWAYETTPEGIRRDPGANRVAPEFADSQEPVVEPPSGESQGEGWPFDTRAIAVLPFANLSERSENDFFADGVGEDILTRLSQIPALHVVSRTSVMRYKGTEKPIPEIARELKVGTILEGSVRRAGDQVRITAQLIEAGPDRHVWAETFDRRLADIFAVQAEVAEDIARALRAQLAPGDLERVRRPLTNSIEAYDLFLEGRTLTFRLLAEELARGMELLKEAITLDPGFSAAYAFLSLAHVAAAYYGFGVGLEELTEARTLADKALTLDPENGRAWMARGIARYHLWDWPGGEADLAKAVDFDPGVSEVLFYRGHELVLHGRPSEAIEFLKRATELAPREPLPYMHYGLSLYLSGREEEGLSQVRRAVDLDPSFFEAPFALGLLLADQGRFDEALPAFSKGDALSGGHPWPKGWLAAACRKAGRIQEAEELAEQLLAPEHGMLGKVFGSLALGRNEDAACGLEKLADDRHPLLIWIYQIPWIRPLFEDHPTISVLRHRIWGYGPVGGGLEGRQ
jgi:TolB-like protein/Flp pilus assembly protein TadD